MDGYFRSDACAWLGGRMERYQLYGCRKNNKKNNNKKNKKKKKSRKYALGIAPVVLAN